MVATIEAKEKKARKGLSKKKMDAIKEQVLQMIAEVEVILPTLSVDGADYEGGYAYIEDSLRVIADALGKFEEYDQQNCEIWAGLADIVIDTLEEAKKQYDGFSAAQKIPRSLIGVKEYINLNEQEIRTISKKTGCTINR